MLDKFARLERERLLVEEQREREYKDAVARAAAAAAVAAATGATPSTGRFVPIDDPAAAAATAAAAELDRMKRAAAAAAARRPRPLRAWPKAVIEREKRERTERVAARKAIREVKAAKWREKQAQRIASSVVKPGGDKDFSYLVRRAEEELGWTGKWDVEEKEAKRPKSTKYSRAALRKEEASRWYNRAVDVIESLTWMQQQLIKEMGLEGVTFGTRRNALLAKLQILRAVLVDEKTDIGKNLRELWLTALYKNFEQAMAQLSDGELATQNDKGKCLNELKRVMRLVRVQVLPDATLKEILLMVDSSAADNLDTGGKSSGENSSRDGDSGEYDDVEEEMGDEDGEDDKEGGDREAEDDQGSEEQTSASECGIESDEESE